VCCDILCYWPRAGGDWNSGTVYETDTIAWIVKNAGCSVATIMARSGQIWYYFIMGDRNPAGLMLWYIYNRLYFAVLF